MSSISIKLCDIEKIETECIVNAANTELKYGSGICHAIFIGAGIPSMTEECKMLGHCPTGSAVVTRAFELPAQWVIHAVGPHTSEDGALDLLRSAYISAMQKVQELDCHKVTMPLISSGAFNDAKLPYEPLWKVAVSAVRDYQEAFPDYPIDVLFACHGQEQVDIGNAVLASPPGINPLDVETLRRKFVFFWREEGQYGCFSQWYVAPFTIEGITYQTCEQYMMAKKALLFKDFENYILIMNAEDPAKDKEYGRLVRNFESRLWRSCNAEIIFHANLAKFSQNPELKEVLLKTGDLMLAEASPVDRNYGIGLEATDPAAKDPANWTGKNLLGETLMKVRSALRDK